jgi:hypothetical protein
MMTIDIQIQLSAVAHTKIILHAAANPDCQVIHGILVGYAEGSSLYVMDVLPVCHSHPTKMILNVSFRLAEEYLRRRQQQQPKMTSNNKNTTIMGWYTAKERRDDTLEPHPTSLRIMSTIHSSTPHSTADNRASPILLCVPNDLSQSYQAYSWDAAQRLPVTVDDPNGIATAALEKSCYGSCILRSSNLPIYDFECHLEGASVNNSTLQDRDWLTNCAVAEFVNGI